MPSDIFIWRCRMPIHHITYTCDQNCTYIEWIEMNEYNEMKEKSRQREREKKPPTYCSLFKIALAFRKASKHIQNYSEQWLDSIVGNATASKIRCMYVQYVEPVFHIRKMATANIESSETRNGRNMGGKKKDVQKIGRWSKYLLVAVKSTEEAK